MKRVFYVLFIVFTVLKTIAQNHVVVGTSNVICVDSLGVVCNYSNYSLGCSCYYYTCPYINLGKTVDIDMDNNPDFNFTATSFSNWSQSGGSSISKISMICAPGFSIGTLPSSQNCVTPIPQPGTEMFMCYSPYFGVSLPIAKSCNVNAWADTIVNWNDTAFIDFSCNKSGGGNSPIPFSSFNCSNTILFYGQSNFFAYKKMNGSIPQYGWFKIIDEGGGAQSVHLSPTTKYIKFLSPNALITRLKEPDVSETDVIIYPNPTKEYISIKGISVSFDFQLYSSDGIKLKEGIVQKMQEIDVRDIDSGIYFVEIKAEGFVIRRKVVVLR